MASPSICDSSRVYNCMISNLDANSDGSLEAAELDWYMNSKPCGDPPVVMSGSWFMIFCDMNHDGLFNFADFNHTLSCFRSAGAKQAVCNICDTCEQTQKK